MQKFQILEKLLKFFYLNNHHKLSVYLIKFISFFDSSIECRLSFYNFFKKRKINYSRELLNHFYEPYVFIFNLEVNTQDLIKKIYNYKKNISKENIYVSHGHVNTFQSEHDLNKKKEFYEINLLLENFINNKISNFYGSQLIKIKKMWFVITKKAGLIKKHSHLDSDLSAVLYLNVDEENINFNDGLKIHNHSKFIKIYKFCEENNNFIISIIKDDNYILKPKVNDLIIFNSYLEHSVENNNSKTSNRISLPFDLEFFIK